MVQFGKLPLIVNEKILRYVLDDAEINICKKLALLGVCHDWRGIAMPLLYHTLLIAEPSSYYHLAYESWELSDPSGHQWCVNVAPFNIRDVFRYAKKLEIYIDTYSGLEHFCAMLEHIFSLESSRPAVIDKLYIWVLQFLVADPNSVHRHFQYMADFLTDIIPSVSSLSLHVNGIPSSFAPYLTPLLAGYSGPSLQMLKSTGMIDASHSINFRCLTVLDLELCEDHYHFLSLIEPQILRKLALHECFSTYIWKYFSSAERSGSQLEFTNLADLCIKSSYYFQDYDDPELDGSFVYQHRLLAKEWAGDIASRRVVFPNLDILRFENCHFVDLFFANCKFPREVAKVLVYHEMSRTFSSCEWILGNIPSTRVSVETHPDQQDDTRDCSSRFIVSQFGNKIINLQMEELAAFEPARINLPVLQTLCIDSIYFSELVSLISKLPRLCQLTLGCLQVNNSLNSRHTDNSHFMLSPTCPSLTKLTVRTLARSYLSGAHACMTQLLNCLTGLRVVNINAKQGSELVLHVADNQGKYPHFKKLEVVLLNISMRY